MHRGMKTALVASAAFMMFASSTMNVSAATLKDFFDAKYYASLYPDLQKAFGNDEKKLYEHYLTFGIKEGRSANRTFNVTKYRELYPDLDAAFGDNWDAYANHYAVFGIREGRDGGGEGGEGMDAYAESYSDIYAAYGSAFFAELEKYDILGKTTEREALITPYYQGRKAMTEKSQSEAVRAGVNSNYEWAEKELTYTSWYYIAYLNAGNTGLKNDFGRLYNGSYKNYAEFRDYVLINGTKEDADNWYDTYHAVSGKQGVSKGFVLPTEVEITE